MIDFNPESIEDMDKRFDDDYYKTKVLERLQENQKLQELRNEVDEYRANELNKEDAFFGKIAEKHSWFAEYQEDAKYLRDMETKEIAKERNLFDNELKLDHYMRDHDWDFEERSNGYYGYQERMIEWSNKLGLDYEPEFQRSQDYLRSHHSSYSDGTLYGPTDFRHKEFKLESTEESEPTFGHEMLKDKYDFWSSMNQKYPRDLVDAELRANFTDPVFDFKDRFTISDDRELTDAYGRHSHLEWTMLGDSRMEAEFERNCHEQELEQPDPFDELTEDQIQLVETTREVLERERREYELER